MKGGLDVGSHGVVKLQSNERSGAHYVLQPILISKSSS
jgi:hypothetical protein